MKKILIIDYDQSSLAALHQTLVKEGFQVVVASDGKSGWDKFEDENPDLVLMEAMLSKIHGFELCERITKNPRRKVPVFIMTAVYKDVIYRTEALRTYGASEYFEKPVDMPSFMAAIHAVLTVPEIRPMKQEPLKVETAAGVGPVNGGNLAAEIPKIPASARGHPKIEQAPVAAPPKGGISTAKSAFDIILPKEEPPKVNAGSVAPVLPVEKPKDAKRKKDTGKDEIDRLMSTLGDLDLGSDKKKAPAKPKAAPLPPIPDFMMEKLKPVLPATKATSLATAVSTPTPVKPPPARQPSGQPARVQPTQVQPASKPAPRPSPTPRPMPAPSPKPVASPPPAAPSKPVESVLKKALPLPEKLPESPPPPKEPLPVAEPQADLLPRMFKDIYEVQKSRTMSPVVGIALLIFVIVVGIFLLKRPKLGSSPAGGLNAASMPAVSNPEDTIPARPPVTKPAVQSQTENTKPKPVLRAGQGNGATGLPGAEDAILDPQLNTASKIVIPPASEQKTGAKSAESKTGGTETPQPQSPPVKTVETSGQESGTQSMNNRTSDTAGTVPAAQPAASAKANPGDLVPLESVDEPPQVQKRVDPAYPTQAQRAKLEGSITVNALINESGNVISTGVLKGMKDDKGLEKAAEAAVKKWKFQPAKKGGVNVKVWMPIVITFKSGISGTE